MVRVKDYKVIFFKKYIQKEYAFKKKKPKRQKAEDIHQLINFRASTVSH